VTAEGHYIAVEGDQNNHQGGDLVSTTSKKIYVVGKPLIVAMKDKAKGDGKMHPFAPTDPSTGSNKVFAYSGSSGGVSG